MKIPDLLGSAVRHHRAGRLGDAEALYRRILEAQPSHPDALHLLGMVKLQTGRPDAALPLIRGALAANATAPEFHFDLGLVLAELGKHAPAIDAFQQAIVLRPGFSEAFYNLGNAQFAAGRLDEAIAAYQQALTLKPDDAAAHNNLGNALQARRQFDLAIEEYRQTLRLRPDFAEAANNMGNALQATHRIDDAIQAYRQALASRPDYAAAHNNLANALKAVGLLDEAIACFDRALAISPDQQECQSSRLYTLPFHPGYDSQRILSEHVTWNARWCAPLGRDAPPHGNDRSPYRRLRIGYISADFRSHCQAFFTLPLLTHHDHAAVEIHCYSDVQANDVVTEQLRQRADVWRNIVGMDHSAVADLIRQDRIDILVDLTLHMASNRLMVFARKPAPVQISWLGYPGTTGLTAMDYRLTDPYLDPPGLTDGNYVEQSIRLPHTFWCYDPLGQEPAPNELPALKNGYITFGCLNGFCKVNDRTLEIWAKTMRAVADSRLLMMAPPGSARQRVARELALRGIDSSRVEFVDFQLRGKYLQTYHRIDLGLDTFPYNGHTTSLDSLWMGVPVITIVGQTVVGRAGWSQLNNLGLSALAADDSGEFVMMIQQLSQDLPALSKLRSTLRARMARSPLTDAPRFARDLEAVYRGAWKKWCGSGD